VLGGNPVKIQTVTRTVLKGLHLVLVLLQVQVQVQVLEQERLLQGLALMQLLLQKLGNSF
jgi:hypothetical protein